MADDQSTVKMQDTSGKLWNVPRASVPKLVYKGFKIASSSGPASATVSSATTAPASGPGPVKRLLTSAAGVPENVDTSLEGNLKGLNKLGTTKAWVDALKQAFESLNPVGGMSEASAAALARMKQPGQRIKGGVEYLMSGFPYAGPAAVRSVEQATEGDWAGSTGSAINAALLARTAPEAAKRLASGPLRVTAQAVAGVGQDVVDKAAREHAQELSNARNNYSETLRKTREANEASDVATVSEHRARLDKIAEADAKALADYRTKVIESRAKFEEGRRASAQVGANAAQLSETLPKLRDQARADAKAAYPSVGGSAPGAELLSDLSDTVDTKLRGTGRVPSSLARIMKELSPIEGRSTGPSIMGRTLDLSNPTDLAAYQRFKSTGAFTPEEIARVEGDVNRSLDFDTLHGMYSELGRQAYSRDLPGDERAAITDARTKILDRMQKLAQAEGKLPRFREAQRGWQVMENTFYNDSPTVAGGSPIARALRTVDPVTKKLRTDYVQAILSDPKANRVAQELLLRYSKPGSDLLRQMRESADVVKSAPKKLVEPKVPEPTPEPSHPAVPYKIPPTEPEGTIFNPVETRRKILQNRVPGDITPGFMLYRQVLRALMRKMAHVPAIQDYLSQNQQ